jgi:methyl-accepting chemotaxis protein
VTKQTSEGTNQAASAAVQLSEKAEQLLRLVGTFKVDSSKAA